MKPLYRWLIITFILSILFGIIAFGYYMQFISNLISNPDFFKNMQPVENGNEVVMPPKEIFDFIFSPVLIISFLITIIASLANKIIGIVLVAQNKQISSDARVLWILGFIFLSFVTNIVFFALKNSKNLLGDKPQDDSLLHSLGR